MEGRTFHVTATVADRRWSGQWTLEGKDICVASAYGSKRAPLGRSKPENVAGRLLREIVEARRP